VLVKSTLGFRLFGGPGASRKHGLSSYSLEILPLAPAKLCLARPRISGKRTAQLAYGRGLMWLGVCLARRYRVANKSQPGVYSGCLGLSRKARQTCSRAHIPNIAIRERNRSSIVLRIRWNCRPGLK
jgi:hypothetical protein